MLEWTVVLLILQCFCVESFLIDCPGSCVCYHDAIECKNMQLTSVPAGLSKKISKLDLSKNQFNHVPEDIGSFRNLTELIFAHNRISVINDNVLANNKMLHNLDFSYNAFSTVNDIYPLAFQQLKNLTRLNLSHNILGITSNIFKSASLKYLDLSNCSITNIDNSFLEAFPQLTELTLSNNPIETITVPLNASNLQILDLSGCKLHSISEVAFIHLPKLEAVNLRNNYELQMFNSKSRSLLYLDLSNCAISLLPTHVFKAVRRVHLSGNRLRVLEDDSFAKFPNVSHLDLSHNLVSSVGREAFRKLDFLSYIHLGYNPINKMDRFTFNTNFRLKTLELSHTYLTEVPSFDIESLESLDLSSGEINIFTSRSLTKMPFLKLLNLSSNFITSIPDNLESESLQALDLTWCRVSSISKHSFSSLPSLTTLSLVGNRLTGAFNVTYFYGIQNLFISENMWRCDCNMTAFLVFNEFMKNNALDYYNLKCSFPDNARGIHWEIYCGRFWYQDDGLRDKSWAIGVGMSVALCVIMCVCYFIKRGYRIREEERRMAEEAEREEARRRLMLLRQRSREVIQEQDRNAPDPRDLQRPPSYHEAILLPRVDTSMASLAGSQASLSSVGDKKKRKRRPRRRSRSKAASESDIVSASSRSINKRNSDSSERQDSSDAEAKPFKGYKESCI